MDKDNMQIRRNNLSKLVAALLGISVTLSVSAIGLGDIQVQGVLNQPFHATVPLSDLGSLNPQDVKVKLASIDKYNEMGIERAGYLSHFQFTIDDSQMNAPKIVITSDTPIDDPIVNILIVVSASGTQFYREYIVFLDPNTPTYGTSAVTPSTSFTPSKHASAQKGEWYGPTVRDDTLWHIAGLYRPAGTSVEQTAVAIYQANRSAFINDDMNKLQVGVRLRIPSGMTPRTTSTGSVERARNQEPVVAPSVVSSPAVVATTPSDVTPQAVAPAQPVAPTQSTQLTQPAPTQSVQPATPAASAPMILSSPKPQEATLITGNGSENNAATTATSTPSNQNMKAELDYVAKSLQTEQATNQLLMTQVGQLQRRNEELQHDLTEKDALVMNLQALLNQKQQSKMSTVTPVSQGGTLPAAQESGSSFGLWFSLIVLLGAAGAAYWQREALLAFIAVQKKALFVRLGWEIDEDEDENQEEEPKQAEVAVEAEKSKLRSSLPDPAEESRGAMSRSETVSGLAKELLHNVDEYVDAKRYNKAELELNLFLSHYPNHIDVSVKLLEIYALMKKKADFDRILHGFSLVNPNLSADIVAKIASLQQTDWQIAASSKTSAVVPEEIESIMSLDEEDNPVEAVPDVEVKTVVPEVKTVTPEVKKTVEQPTEKPIVQPPPEAPTPKPMETVAKEKEPAEQSAQKPDVSSHVFVSLSDRDNTPAPSSAAATPPSDTHNIEFVQGLGEGFKPALRGAEASPEEASTDNGSSVAPAVEAPKTPKPELVDDPKDGAKIDLSETYFSMGEYGAARKLLEDVLSSKTSSQAQRDKAQQGLDRIEHEHARRHVPGGDPPK